MVRLEAGAGGLHQRIGNRVLIMLYALYSTYNVV